MMVQLSWAYIMTSLSCSPKHASKQGSWIRLFFFFNVVSKIISFNFHKMSGPYGTCSAFVLVFLFFFILFLKGRNWEKRKSRVLWEQWGVGWQSEGRKEHSGKALSLEHGWVILSSLLPRKGHKNTVIPTCDVPEVKHSRNGDWKRMGSSWNEELSSLKIHFCLRGEFLATGFQMHPSLKNRNMYIILKLIYEPCCRGLEMSKHSIVI